MSEHCLHCVIMEAIVKFVNEHPNKQGEPEVPAEYLAEALTNVAMELSHMAGADQRAVFTTFLTALVNEAPQFGVHLRATKVGEAKPQKSKLN